MTQAHLPIDEAELPGLFAPLGSFRVLVLAVSGGCDSMALMHLAADWRQALRAQSSPDMCVPDLVVVTIDHGLRSDSAAEAAFVAREAGGRGLAHRTLRWAGPHPASGVQAAAREARYDLLHAVAREMGGAVVTAHTASDQAETFVMRLLRGSGVDGLAAMPVTGAVTRAALDGCPVTIPLLRPLLGVSRDRLYATLAGRKLPFVEDPSNADRRFERVRVRQALQALEGLGLSREALVRATGRMQRAHHALAAATDALQARDSRLLLDAVHEVDWTGLVAEPELGIRLLRRLVGDAGGGALAAELSAVEAAFERVRTARGRFSFTLGGAIIEGEATAGGVVLIFREPDRAGGLQRIRLSPGMAVVWDDRFQAALWAGHPGSVEIGPLGSDIVDLLAKYSGLSPLPVPAGAVRGLPAFRQDDELVAVPALAELLRSRGDEAGARALLGPTHSVNDDHNASRGPNMVARRKIRKG
ncbi:MAG: tRNA lysidine(34) synthetase TilS [Hyphomicrobiaceae bacterium]